MSMSVEEQVARLKQIASLYPLSQEHPTGYWCGISEKWFCCDATMSISAVKNVGFPTIVVKRWPKIKAEGVS